MRLLSAWRDEPRRSDNVFHPLRSSSYFGCTIIPARYTRAMYDKPLATAKHEEFAQAVVRINNQARAWREVYDPEGRYAPRQSWVEGCRLSNSIHVGRRIEWLRGQALERSQISVVAMMQDLHDIATADGSELCSVIVVNCRHCHGLGFKYQWLGTDEYATACEQIAAFNEGAKAKKPMPDCEGGFDFDPHRDPNAICPHCLGVGRREERVADTSTLSDKARKLFTGTLDKYGRPVLHDQLAARDQLHKILGAYKTDSNGGALTPPMPQPGEAPKAGDASVSYLAMIHGGRKSA